MRQNMNPTTYIHTRDIDTIFKTLKIANEIVKIYHYDKIPQNRFYLQKCSIDVRRI